MKITFLPLVLCGLAFAQDFDVVSLKPAPNATSFADLRISGGPGTNSPENYYYRGATLRALLARAFGVADQQQQIEGPRWIDTERYEISARMPVATTEEQFQQMLRRTLTRRFHLMLRTESKVLAVYEMTVAGAAPKAALKLSQPLPEETPRAPITNTQDANGFPVVPPTYTGFAMRSGTGASGQQTQNWVIRRMSMQQVANNFKVVLGRVVLDKTGLPGVYDFNLQYDTPRRPGQNAIPDAPEVTLGDAMEQQLGLRLVDTKAAFNLIVVESGNPVPDKN